MQQLKKIQVLLDRQHAESLVEVIKARIEMLQYELVTNKTLLERLLQDINEMSRQIHDVSEKPKPPFLKYQGSGVSGYSGYSGYPFIEQYNKEWSFFEKAKFILKQKNRPMSTSEIADAILANYEPDELDDRPKIVRNISNVLGVNSKEDGQLKRIKVDGDYLYSFSEVDKNIQIKKPQTDTLAGE